MSFPNVFAWHLDQTPNFLITNLYHSIVYLYHNILKLQNIFQLFSFDKHAFFGTFKIISDHLIFD